MRRLIFTLISAAFFLVLLGAFLHYSGRWDAFVEGIRVWMGG